MHLYPCFLLPDHDRCCSTVRIDTTGPSNTTQKARMGLYERVDTFFDRPVYLHQVRPLLMDKLNLGEFSTLHVGVLVYATQLYS